MKVIIPLAGFGTRLRPHTYTKPKPLMNVAGKPVLGHLLDKLAGLEIEEYIFIVGYLGEQIEEYVKNQYKLNARFVEQREMLGQAHAIWLAREYLDDKDVFIVFGDTLFDADLSSVGKTDSDAVIFVKEVEDPRSFGVVTLDPDGYITSLVEKPDTLENRLAVVGLYYFKHGDRLIKAIERLIELKETHKNEYILAGAIDIMLKDGDKFRTHPINVWLDCGRPDTVLDTNRYLLEHGSANGGEFKDHDTTIIISPVSIHPSAKIDRSVIGPYVTIAANCVISNAIVRDAIIDRGAICKETLIEQSLVGSNARVEGGFRKVNVGDSSAIEFAG